MFRALIPAAVALGLVAFAVQTRSADPLESPAMAWSLTHEGDMAKLAYGVPHSDVLALMVTCSPGRGTAVVYGDVQPAGVRLIRASQAPRPLDPLSGGEAEEVEIAIDHPELRALARSGRMTVEAEGGVFALPASMAERGLARDFLAYCATGRA